MSIEEENKATARRIIEEVWNKGNVAVAGELMTTSNVFHGPIGMEFKGLESLKSTVTMYRTAFPDVHMTIEDMVAEGDKVAYRYTMRGTHKGELMGIAPTGKQVTFTVIVISRFEGGKEAEVWASEDLLGMMQQLGAIPS